VPHQGDQAIENYAEEICAICHQVDFNDITLKDIFRVGLKELERN